MRIIFKLSSLLPLLMDVLFMCLVFDVERTIIGIIIIAKFPCFQGFSWRGTCQSGLSLERSWPSPSRKELLQVSSTQVPKCLGFCSPLVPAGCWQKKETCGWTARCAAAWWWAWELQRSSARICGGRQHISSPRHRNPLHRDFQSRQAMSSQSNN